MSSLPRTLEAAKELGCNCDACPLSKLSPTPVHSDFSDAARGEASSGLSSDAAEHNLRTTGGTSGVASQPASPVVLFVGEGPGYNETEAGKPFVGAGGELLRGVIESAITGASTRYNLAPGTATVAEGGTATSRFRVAYGNVTRCRFPSDFTERQKLKAAACCVPGLWTEIRRLKPAAICLLGKIAANAFRMNKWNKRRGHIHPAVIDSEGVHYKCP